MKHSCEGSVDDEGPRAGKTTVEHDWEQDGSLSITIVRAVSSVTGRPPHDLTPLHDAIDTDALDTLFKHASPMNRRDDGQLSFPTNGTRVTVRADGEIVVTHSPDDHEE